MRTGNFPFKRTTPTWEELNKHKTWEDRYGPAPKLGDYQRSGETHDEWQSRVNPKDYKVKTRKDDSKRKVVDKTGDNRKVTKYDKEGDVRKRVNMGDGKRKVTKYDKEGGVRKTVTWDGGKRTVERPGDSKEIAEKKTPRAYADTSYGQTWKMNRDKYYKDLDKQPKFIRERLERDFGEGSDSYKKFYSDEFSKKGSDNPADWKKGSKVGNFIRRVTNRK